MKINALESSSTLIKISLDGYQLGVQIDVSKNLYYNTLASNI